MKTIGAYYKTMDDPSCRHAQVCLRRLGVRQPVRLREFAADGMLGGDPGNERATGSMLEPIAAGSFDVVYVDPCLRLFTNEWGKAFLRQLIRSLREHGVLCLPYRTDEAGGPRIGWSRSWLEELLETRGESIDGPGPFSRLIRWRRPSIAMAGFTCTRQLSRSHSILDWWFSDHGETTQEDTALLSGNRVPGDIEKRCREFLMVGDESSAITPPIESSIEKARDCHYKEMTYAIIGANYKSALLGFIINTRLPAGRPLRVLDHGGGFGTVAMELLLEHPRIEKAVNCEPDIRHLIPMARLFDFHRERLRGRYYLRPTTAQDVVYDDTYDVISFLGSLLYLPRADVDRTLDRAWEALKPGGILVVHENVKDPRFVRDYARMFTVDELTRTLGRLGPVDCYASTSLRKIAAHEAGNKTVFRVLQKSEA